MASEKGNGEFAVYRRILRIDELISEGTFPGIKELMADREIEGSRATVFRALDFISKVDVVKTIPYSDVKYFPVCTTSSHEGNLVFGTLEGVNLVIMQGRVHYYEGYDMKTVTLPIYVMNQLGAETLILTIMDKELKALVWFGVLLGFLMGFVTNLV